MPRKNFAALLLVVGMGLAAAFYGLVCILAKGGPVYEFFCGHNFPLDRRAFYQYGSLAMFFYGGLLLAAYYSVLRAERAALRLSFPERTVRPQDAAALAAKLPAPYRDTILGRRLLNLLHGYARREEVGPLLSGLAENDRQEMERGMSLLSWVRSLPPIFGLLGTLDGLRNGTAQISRINTATDLEPLRRALQDFAHSSSTAFDTTLLGITCAVLVSAGIFLLRKSQDELLARVDQKAHELALLFSSKSPAEEVAAAASDELKSALREASAQAMRVFQAGLREGLMTTAQGWLEAWKSELAAATKQVLEHMKAHDGYPAALVHNVQAAVERLEAIERALQRPHVVQIRVAAEAAGTEVLS